MEVLRTIFGKNKDGKEVYKYLVSGENISAEFCDTGASIMSIVVKNSQQEKVDVLLGLEGYEAYQRNWPAFGAVIGRCANRIKGAKFTLNEKKYSLKKNIMGGCLHSGFSYHYRDFDSEYFVDGTDTHIIFKLFSADGDQGYPGNLEIKVEYVVKDLDKPSITINYYATSDADTIVNMTNHAYFNLNGHNSGTAMNHRLKIYADKVTQFDKNLMPTGNIMDVRGSAYDFTELTKISDNLNKDFKPISKQKEYDMNYVLSDKAGEMKKAVYLEGEVSNICMCVFTDMPGMQFYTGNAVKGIKGKNKTEYCQNPGLCFETQYYPNAINQENFESPILRAGEEMHRITRFEFSVKECSNVDRKR